MADDATSFATMVRLMHERTTWPHQLSNGKSLKKLVGRHRRALGTRARVPSRLHSQASLTRTRRRRAQVLSRSCSWTRLLQRTHRLRAQTRYPSQRRLSLDSRVRVRLFYRTSSLRALVCLLSKTRCSRAPARPSTTPRARPRRTISARYESASSFRASRYARARLLWIAPPRWVILFQLAREPLETRSAMRAISSFSRACRCMMQPQHGVCLQMLPWPQKMLILRAGARSTRLSTK